MDERSLRPSCLVAARLTRWYCGSRGKYNEASKTKRTYSPTVWFVPGLFVPASDCQEGEASAGLEAAISQN